MNKCLYCYEPINEDSEFHDKCSKSFFGTAKPPVFEYGLDQMAELAKNVVESKATVTGVQPKLSLSMIRTSIQEAQNRLTIVGALGGRFIFKPPSEYYKEMPANEHLTMRMAEVFGIRVVESSLIRLASGELGYITKRIDRDEAESKTHMLDMFQITEAFDKYRSSMEKVGKALKSYSRNPKLDQVYLLELTVFCFLTGNNDMHLKNFSMIEKGTGWELAPAYDLLNVSIVLPEDKEELALTLNAKKRKFKRAHFEDYGLSLGLNKKQVDGVFKRFEKNRAKAKSLIKNSFLTEEMQTKYIELLDERFNRLELLVIE
jgi:serine/threonine-protein kinase HipA